MERVKLRYCCWWMPRVQAPGLSLVRELWLAPWVSLARVSRAAAPASGTPSPTWLRAPSFEKVPIHMAAMNFLMTDGAVLKHRGTQIVKSRRHDARNLRWRRGEKRVTLQAYKTDIGARQHPGIRRAMWLVTRLAAFKTHRSMLERERSTLVAMAREATWVVGRETLEHRGPDAAMGVVAVHAGHGAFWKFVVKRPLE